MTTRTEWLHAAVTTVEYGTIDNDEGETHEALVLASHDRVAVTGTREELLELTDAIRFQLERPPAYAIGALNRTTPAELLRLHAEAPQGIAFIVATDQGDDEPPAWAELDEIHEDDDGTFEVCVVYDSLTVQADGEVEWTAVKLPATTPAPRPDAHGQISEAEARAFIDGLDELERELDQ